MGRAVTSGVKGGDDIRVPRLRGGPRRSQPTEASLKRRWGQLTGHCCVSSRVTTAYHLHVFFQPCHFKHSKEFKAFKQKMRKKLNWVHVRRVWCTRREPRLTDRNTELSFASSERTNTIPSLNMQTEKDVKEPNSAPARHEQRDASQSASMPNSFLLALVPTNTLKFM